MRNLDNNLHERIKNWWGKMQKKTLIEKSLFSITIILGLSVILGGIFSGCYFILPTDGCNENCKQCVSIPSIAIALLIVSIVYTTQHGRTDDEWLEGLQEKFGDNNAMIVFICSIASMFFFATFPRIFMPGNIMLELVLVILIVGFFVFMLIPVSLLEKIKKIIKCKTINIEEIKKEVKFGKRTWIEKILFAITIILGLSVIIGSIVSGCYFVLPTDGCDKNCKQCTSISAIATVLLIAGIVYATHHGRDDLNPLQKRLGNNNTMIVLVCFGACAFFSAEFLQVLTQDRIIYKLVLLVFGVSLAIFVYIPISWLKKIKNNKH